MPEHPFLTKARYIPIPEYRQTVLPVAVGSVAPDAAAFLGWSFAAQGTPEEFFAAMPERSMSQTFDFGTNLTGYLTIKLRFEREMDAPFQIKIILGETARELGENFDDYAGDLGRGWLQQEFITLDDPQAEIRLPRRYTFRYVRLEVLMNSSYYRYQITGLSAETVTSADVSQLAPPPEDLTPLEKEIDRIAVNTLKNCMQQVFEDGPKRDRRLWIGDLRLQALANAQTFRHFDLVKKCLYLFAGTVNKQGEAVSCVFCRQSGDIRPGNAMIFDYNAQVPVILLEYLQASGDRATALELYDFAKAQIDGCVSQFDDDGVFRNQGKRWLFIDWQNELDRQTSEHGVVIWALKKAATLAETLGKNADARQLTHTAQSISETVMKHFWDQNLQLFVSGETRQISWASQAWLTLASVLPAGQSAQVMQRVLAMPQAVKPGGPYLYSLVIEALIAANLPGLARRMLNDYWGEMAAAKFDTFPEVFDAHDPLRSPYKSVIVNSFCHAWSCTPTAFLRSGELAKKG